MDLTKQTVMDRQAKGAGEKRIPPPKNPAGFLFCAGLMYRNGSIAARFETNPPIGLNEPCFT
jgi:hypothetical protein